MHTLLRACSGFVSVQSHKFRQFLCFVVPALLLDFLVTVFLAVLVV